MILVIHANMISLAKPTSFDLTSNPTATSTRYVIESFGIVGVDVFVLISGWFCINTRAKSFLSLCFQILMLWGGAYLLFLLIGKAELSSKSVLEVIMFTKWDWFVKAYVVLMIIAPVLNTFVKFSQERQQRYVLLGFFAFSSSYGWLGGGNRFFVNGYGPLLFIGLYLLAQYAHQAINKNGVPKSIQKLFILNKMYDLLIFTVCVLLNSVLGLIVLYLNVDRFATVYAYTNPITIIGALYLLLFFSKIDIKTNKVINILASGSFAAYLLHSEVHIRPFFNKAVEYLYSSFDNVNCILTIFAFLIIVYIVSVVIDLPRLWLWNIISKRFNLK